MSYNNLLFDWLVFNVLLIIQLQMDSNPPLHSIASITALAQCRPFDITYVAQLACVRNNGDLSQGQSDLKVYMQQLGSTALQYSVSCCPMVLATCIATTGNGTVTVFVDMVAMAHGVGHCSAVPVQHANLV